MMSSLNNDAGDDSSQDILLEKQTKSRGRNEGAMNINDFVNNEDSQENEVSNLDIDDEFEFMNIISKNQDQNK